MNASGLVPDDPLDQEPEDQAADSQPPEIPREKSIFKPRSKRALTMLVDPVWERQPGETAQQFQKFVAFRDTPPNERYLPQVADRLGLKYGTAKQLSFRMRWTQRATAWDDEKDRQIREQQLEAVKKMNERHAEQAQAFQIMAMLPLQALGRRIKDDPGVKDFAGLLPVELLEAVGRTSRMWKEMAMMERMARGETTTEVGVRENEGDDLASRISKSPDATKKLHAALYDVYVADQEEHGETPLPLPAPLVPDDLDDEQDFDDDPLEQEPDDLTQDDSHDQE